MTECRIDTNTKRCACTYDPCSRKGLCCECIAYHRKNGEIPGCLFPPDAEKSYDRSVRRFVQSVRSKP